MLVGRPGKLLFVACAVALCFASTEEAAHAKDRSQTVAIAGLEVEGDASRRFRKKVESVVVKGLAEAGFGAVKSKAVKTKARRRGVDLSACTDADCLGTLAAQVSADRLLWITVSSSGPSYEIELRVYWPDGDVQTHQDTCGVCTVGEAHKKLLTAVRTAVGLPKKPADAPVVIVTDPKGASLRIAGEDVGVAPYTSVLPPGDHLVTARLEGYDEASITITVAPGTEPQRFSFTLIKTAVPDPSPDDVHTGGNGHTGGTGHTGGNGGSNLNGGGNGNHGSDVRTPPGRPFATLKWIGVVTSLSAIGTGLVWVGIDGQGTCNEDDEGTCKFLRNTRTQGYITAGVGAAVGLFTVYMFFRDASDARKQREFRATVAPTKGGALGVVEFRF